MGCGRMKVECADGFEVVTKDSKELVALVGWHLKSAHHKEAPEAEILKMAKHP
jgi:predicted small metal-binding protein